MKQHVKLQHANESHQHLTSSLPHPFTRNSSPSHPVTGPSGGGNSFSKGSLKTYIKLATVAGKGRIPTYTIVEKWRANRCQVLAYSVYITYTVHLFVFIIYIYILYVNRSNKDLFDLYSTQPAPRTAPHTPQDIPITKQLSIGLRQSFQSLAVGELHHYCWWLKSCDHQLI